MDAVIHPPSSLDGTLVIPPDKSICHRAVLLAAAASGQTRIQPWPQADDCRRTLGVIQSLGIRAQASADGLVIEGGAGRFKAPAQPLDCHESGTTLRLSAGLLAGQPFASELSASPSLARRPMQRIVEPLTRMGALIRGRTIQDQPDVYPPLSIQGRRPLTAIDYAPSVASAQVKSAILLAALFADGPTRVVEKQPTRDHTERALRAFGVSVSTEGPAVTVNPQPLVSPGALTLPGDVSSAAFFMVAASIVPHSQVTLEGVSLNPTRCGILAVLKRMGASIDIAQQPGDAWEPRGRITIRSAALKATVVEAVEVAGIIDEIPVLMVAAAAAEGTTLFQGVEELRVKEADRIQSMTDGLSRLGAKVRIVGQGIVEVAGPSRLSGCVVDSAGDHRTAMSLAVAALTAAGDTTIRGAECVAKSFPEFFSLLALAGGSPTVKTIDKAGGLC